MQRTATLPPGASARSRRARDELPFAPRTRRWMARARCVASGLASAQAVTVAAILGEPRTGLAMLGVGVLYVLANEALLVLRLRRCSSELPIQLALDVFFVTVLLYLGGMLGSPLAAGYVAPILAATIFYGPRAGGIALLLACFTYAIAASGWLDVTGLAADLSSSDPAVRLGIMFPMLATWALSLGIRQTGERALRDETRRRYEQRHEATLARLGRPSEQLEHLEQVIPDPLERALRSPGDSRDLGRIERVFDELAVPFARHPSHVFTRATLLDRVWGTSHRGYEHTVNSHIDRLRAKLEASPNEPRWIRTVWGVGYRFDPSGGGGDGEALG